MNDALNTALTPGDTVAFVGSRVRKLEKGRVVGFSPKQIQILIQEMRWNTDLKERVMTDVVVTRPPEYVAKIG